MRIKDTIQRKVT